MTSTLVSSGGVDNGLTFDPMSHTYHADGRVVPGVTTVLGRHLDNFDGVPRLVLERAGRIGTAVHAMVDYYNQGILDMDSLDEDTGPRLEAYVRFLGETGLKVTSSEQRVFNRDLWYAGTCDIVGTMRDTSWVIDIKSGRVPLSVGPQMAAYQEALVPRPRRRLWVQLKKDGDYDMGECTGSQDFTVFQSALNIWNFKHAHKPND